VVALWPVVYYAGLPVFRHISIFVTLSYSILEIFESSTRVLIRHPGIMSSDPHSEYQIPKTMVPPSDTIFSYSSGTASKPTKQMLQ
jgi:hypothetical protein